MGGLSDLMTRSSQGFDRIHIAVMVDEMVRKEGEQRTAVGRFTARTK